MSSQEIIDIVDDVFGVFTTLFTVAAIVVIIRNIRKAQFVSNMYLGLAGVWCIHAILDFYSHDAWYWYLSSLATTVLYLILGIALGVMIRRD